MQQSFYLFTPTEIALYFYLLESANVRKWPDTFTCINRKVENDLGVSYKTLAAAKNRLRQTELIDFKSKNGSKTTTFSLTYGNITKVGDEVRDEVSAEVLGEVGAEVSLAYNNVPVKDIKTKTINNNIPPLSPKGEKQEIYLRELEQDLANREADLKKREEALVAAEKKAGKPKNPPSRLNSEARKVFEEYYRSTFSSDYYWTSKDAGSMTALLQKLKFQRKQKNMTTDDEGVLKALAYLLKTISDGWLLEHLSVSNINAYFNEIVSQAIGKHPAANNGLPLFSQQSAALSKIENLQQTGGEAAELARQILNNNG